MNIGMKPCEDNSQSVRLAEAFAALADGEIDGNEAACLRAHFAKLGQFFRDAEQRMAAVLDGAK